MKRALFAVVMVLAAQSLAATSSTKRVAALIIPMDRASEDLTLQIEGFADAALNEFDLLAVRSTEEVFTRAEDEEANASLKSADANLAEARAAFDEKRNDIADRKLRAALRDYEASVAVMTGCTSYCDALILEATVQQMRGDADGARATLMDLLALKPGFELDKKRTSPQLQLLKSQVVSGRQAQLRGSLTVKSKPSGARVFIDGDPQGFAPFTATMLPVGKHLVRVERPGFRTVGRVVEVTTEDAEITEELLATAGYKAYDSLMDRLAGEALKDKGGSTMSSLAISLKIDEAVIGVLKRGEAETIELTLAYFDLKSGKRYAVKRTRFQGDEFGQLKGEVGRIVTQLVNSAGGSTETVSKSSDPLDHKAGTEDWQGDDRGGKNTKRDKKHKGGDPLDNTNGTEDW